MRIRHVNAVIFHILLFLCGTLFFWTSNAVASEQNQVPISVLADKARTALTEKDEETFYTHMDHIFERITGIPASSLKVPEGMGDDESSRKMCEYTKVSEQILTPEILGVMRHQSALIAYSAVLDGVEDDLIKSGITDCTYDDGQPVKTAQFMIDGIAWAQAFQSADAAQAQAMAQDIKALSQRNPQVGELAKLAKLVGFHAQDKQLAENPKPKNRVHRSDERRVGKKSRNRRSMSDLQENNVKDSN